MHGVLFFVEILGDSGEVDTVGLKESYYFLELLEAVVVPAVRMSLEIEGVEGAPLAVVVDDKLLKVGSKDGIFKQDIKWNESARVLLHCGH